MADTLVTQQAFFVLTVLADGRRGLIEPDQEEARDGRLRRYYRLTENGRRALALGPPPGPAVTAGGLRSLRAATVRMVRAKLRRTGRHAAG